MFLPGTHLYWVDYLNEQKTLLDITLISHLNPAYIPHNERHSMAEQAIRNSLPDELMALAPDNWLIANYPASFYQTIGIEQLRTYLNKYTSWPSDPMPLFEHALEHEDAHLLQALVITQRHVNPNDQRIIDALNKFTWLNNSAILTPLLQAGANPNQQDTLGNTPLITAIQLGKKEAVMALLD